MCVAAVNQGHAEALAWTGGGAVHMILGDMNLTEDEVMQNHLFKSLVKHE